MDTLIKFLENKINITFRKLIAPSSRKVYEAGTLVKNHMHVYTQTHEHREKQKKNGK